MGKYSCPWRYLRAKQRHGEQGLEIVGVSCDRSAAELQAFLKENPGVAWPQLYEQTPERWHPLMARYHVRTLPAMFLIGRDGVLRSVSAKNDYRQSVPKLLEEK